MRQMIKMATLLILTACFATAANDERFFEESFQVSPDARFSLDSHKGKIRIRPSAVDQIIVHARIHLGDDADAELLDAVDIKVRNGDDFVSVEVDFNDKKRGLKRFTQGGMTWPFVDFDIQVPAGASLMLESHKGEFDVEVPTGRIDIESHKGTGTISGVSNDFRLDSHKGKFDVEVLELHDIAIETHKGDITVAIHNANDFQIRGESHKGDFRVRGRDFRAYRSKDKEVVLEHRAGSGKNRIDLETHKGTITLDFVN